MQLFHNLLLIAALTSEPFIKCFRGIKDIGQQKVQQSLILQHISIYLVKKNDATLVNTQTHTYIHVYMC